MTEIRAEELKRRLEEDQPVEVVDIREADEFASSHIQGSRNVPVYKALRRNQVEALLQRAAALPKDRPIVTVCVEGKLSLKAAELLRSLDLDASSLAGGIRGWGAVWSEAPIDCGEGVTFLQIRRNGKGCLSYLFGAGGQAAVVDPSVDCSAYLEIAEREGLKIVRVLETHVHADHISRARELCRRTGAELVMPRNRRVNYAYTPVEDGDKITVGEITVGVIATPGHTQESACYLVNDAVLLTGDTLFVNAVGRPDLEKGDAGAEAGARALYHSLRNRLFGRFDDVRIYPTHHGQPLGFDRTPVGVSLRDVRSSLDLLERTEQQFVDAIVSSLNAKPPNHEEIIAINEGRKELGVVDPLQLEAGPNRCAAG
jgi:glyoxylase-like metal-dependent hydrolase (beta-lactamase superfamily II)/rhodanese-related sulfurtransferase